MDCLLFVWCGVVYLYLLWVVCSLGCGCVVMRCFGLLWFGFVFGCRSVLLLVVGLVFLCCVCVDFYLWVSLINSFGLVTC